MCFGVCGDSCVSCSRVCCCNYYKGAAIAKASRHNGDHYNHDGGDKHLDNQDDDDNGDRDDCDDDAIDSLVNNIDLGSNYAKSTKKEQVCFKYFILAAWTKPATAATQAATAPRAAAAAMAANALCSDDSEDLAFATAAASA